MIVEVALGVVLAVLILRLLPAVILGIILIGATAFLGTILLLVWLNFEKLAVVIAGIGACSLLYGIPFWLNSKVTAKYPTFGALVRGEAPYDQLPKQPKRLLVMVLFALTVTCLGIAAFLGAVYVVVLISQTMGY